MQNNNIGDNSQPAPQKKTSDTTIVVTVIAIALVVTWAVATLFEIALVKALAIVILILFGAAIMLFMGGML